MSEIKVVESQEPVEPFPSSAEPTEPAETPETPPAERKLTPEHVAIALRIPFGVWAMVERDPDFALEESRAMEMAKKIHPKIPQFQLEEQVGELLDFTDGFGDLGMEIGRRLMMKKAKALERAEGGLYETTD